MGELVSVGTEGRGYLVKPSGPGPHPGILVVQEWWGLDSGIKEMAERLGKAGFVALAPDLYRGELAQHDEMDKANELMTKLPPDRAAHDMSAALDVLKNHADVASPRGLGVVGFCMGGMLSWIIAANRPDVVTTIVPFYGYPPPPMEPDWSKFSATVQGHMAETDGFFGPEGAKALEAKLRGMGKDVSLTVYPGTSHAFMGPHNALGSLNEKLAAEIWPKAMKFLHDSLDPR